MISQRALHGREWSKFTGTQDDSDELWWEPLDELVELTILPADSYTHCRNTNCRRALLAGDWGQDCGDHWYCDACANKPR
ncbi:hypothetical protein [Mycobacterium intracellulare]|uniref:hypothetical protein n=1 Tax=Mycobacterium intracellulare TaxID=1767 RepID=UPI001EEEE4A5|nr:hypothetical protein [Mycobacterium intracellulare]MEE3755227.1 hypothetical protein [Mycobacterium intracellulare]